MKLKFLSSTLLTAGLATIPCFAITSCSQPQIKTGEFAFDSWQTISKVAKKGLQALKDAYHPIGGTFIIQDLDNDVEKESKTRQLFIEGVGNFEVRVIGENHDIDANGKPIALTFEFKSLVNAVKYSPSDVKSNCYETSQLRNFLNNKFLQWAGSDFANSIIPAKKTTCIGNGSSQTKQTVDKVFPLSVSEIGLLKFPSQPLDEGQIYQFYDMYKDKQEQHDVYDRHQTNYWLRSPMANTYYNAWIVRDSQPSTLDFDDISDVFGVSPAFCI